MIRAFADVSASAALYAPLMATLLALTAPPFDPPPDIVIAYKVRPMTLAESFQTDKLKLPSTNLSHGTYPRRLPSGTFARLQALTCSPSLIFPPAARSAPMATTGWAFSSCDGGA